MDHATEVDIAVAFIDAPGMRLLLPDLLAALVRPQASHPSDPPRRIRVLTSDYLDITDPRGAAAASCRLLPVVHGPQSDERGVFGLSHSHDVEWWPASEPSRQTT